MVYEELGRWLSVADVCRITGFHANTVRRAIHSGELPAGRHSPKAQWRVHTAALGAWLADHSPAVDDGQGAA